MQRNAACFSCARTTDQAIIAEGEAAALPCFCFAASRAARRPSHRTSINMLAGMTVSRRLVMAGCKAGGRTLPFMGTGVEEMAGAGGADLAAAGRDFVAAAEVLAAPSVARPRVLAASPVTTAISWPISTVSSTLIFQV